MKQSSPEQPRGTISHTKARNCALVNQLATPGLGSLMGGRRAAGTGQLGLSVTGFGLVIYWFLRTMADFYGMMFDQQSEPASYGKWGLAGAAVFGASWCWSLVTSVSLLREARRNESNLASP